MNLWMLNLFYWGSPERVLGSGRTKLGHPAAMRALLAKNPRSFDLGFLLWS